MNPWPRPWPEQGGSPSAPVVFSLCEGWNLADCATEGQGS